MGESIQGSLHVERNSGSMRRFADEWSHIGWGDTDKNGDYELSLAAGRAQVKFQGQGLVAIPDHFDLDVAANGSTMVPEFKVRPMPKVRGIVLDENGKPKAKAIVRFRSSILIFALQPVATDENGRFELAPPFIPEDFQTHEKLVKQKILAFDPYHLMSAQAEIGLDYPNKMGDVVLTLKPQTTELLSSEVFDDLPEWARGVVPEEERARLARISLAGKPAPELDGTEWLNTAGKPMSLSNFKGKYVLLQFWTTWCGPCHAGHANSQTVRRVVSQSKCCRDRHPRQLDAVGGNQRGCGQAEADVPDCRGSGGRTNPGSLQSTWNHGLS